MDLACWQKYIPGSTPLSLINLPGTHDSATQFVALPLFSRCQRLSVAQQMQHGIRLLDIRLEFKDSFFHAVHGIAGCRVSKARHAPPLHFQDIFTAILDFLADNPSETIVVSVKMDRGTNTDDFFPAFFNQFIANNPTIWFLENRIPILDECRGKAVLLRRCSLGNSGLPFSDSNSGLDFSDCFNRAAEENCLSLPCSINSISGVPSGCTAVIQDRFMLNPPAKWKKAVKPGLLNPKAENDQIFINYLSTAGMPFIPRINSTYVNSKFNIFELAPSMNYGWICCDFSSEITVNKIVQSNFR